MQKVEELINYFTNAYGFQKDWPKKFEVSPELYGRVCQAVFDHCWYDVPFTDNLIVPITVILGPNKGIMFKNVELIMKKESEPLAEPRTAAGSLD